MHAVEAAKFLPAAPSSRQSSERIWRGSNAAGGPADTIISSPGSLLKGARIPIPISISKFCDEIRKEEEEEAQKNAPFSQPARPISSSIHYHNRRCAIETRSRIPPEACPGPQMMQTVIQHALLYTIVQSKRGAAAGRFGDYLCADCDQFTYRARNKGIQILLSNSQAGPDRTVKQEQEEISSNHAQAFTYFRLCTMRGCKKNLNSPNQTPKSLSLTTGTPPKARGIRNE